MDRLCLLCWHGKRVFFTWHFLFGLDGIGMVFGFDIGLDRIV